MAEFEGLGVVQFGEIGGCDVGGIEAMGEDGKMSMPGAVGRVFGGGKCCYGSAVEERGEDVGAGSFGGAIDKVGCCARGSGRFGEGQEGLRSCQYKDGSRGFSQYITYLQGVEGFGLLHSVV